MTLGGSNSVEATQLRSFIERIERLHVERKTTSDDIADIYKEARGTGYDVKVMREIVKIRGQDREKRQEHEAILSLYLQALGEPS